jgi:hypothetical protein
MRQAIGFVSCLAAVFVAGPAFADERTATPETIRQQVAALRPGDTLTLQPGVYPGGIWLKGLHGRADAPITISGATRAGRPTRPGRWWPGTGQGRLKQSAGCRRESDEDACGKPRRTG